MSSEDHLPKDPEITNQKYVCLSVLTNSSIKDHNGDIVKTDNTARGIKIRGVYATLEDAQKRAEQVRNFDPTFNVFVGEVGAWLPWEDDIDKAEDAVYVEEKLNTLMKGYKDQQVKSKEYQELRRHNDIQNSIKKVKESKKENEIKEEENEEENIVNENITEDNIVEEEKEIKRNKDELSDLRKQIETKDSQVYGINSELEKARELFEELTKGMNENKK